MNKEKLNRLSKSLQKLSEDMTKVREQIRTLKPALEKARREG